ncbi:hypothetical protein BpHYR1_003796, partial [Brachionus plicatilis]
RVSLVSIVYHILLNLIQSSVSLLNKNNQTDEPSSQFESDLYKSIYDSFRIMCSASANNSEYNSFFQSDYSESLNPLIQIQQSSLISTLALKNTSNLVIMKLLAIYFQYCSLHVFEPLNVYEKCKVFMCSMRCSDDRKELLCMIESLTKILSNKDTSKKIRIILLREHLSYLCKLTSNTNDSDCFISLTSECGFELVKSLIDLFESMVALTKEDQEDSNSVDETLTIYVHILGAYLNLEENDTKIKRKQTQLNDIVIKKLLNLGLNYKQEFKQVLEKWPELKSKIGNAFKASASQKENAQTSNQSSSGSKTPKIQLNFNFSKK